MSRIKKLKYFFTDRRKRFYYLEQLGLFRKMPDEKYLKAKFRSVFGYALDLDNPQTCSEKQQWLKLYDRKPVYTTMVDKYAAKEFVAERIGEEYIIPTLGVWNSFDEIDFSTLPDSFVLKCTHDSGGLVICRDKKTLDLEKAKSIITKSLQQDYYLKSREWPYKNVPHRIIAETYMQDGDRRDLRDYKIFCCSGEPKFLYLSEGLEDHSTAHISYLTLDWERAPFYRPDFRQFETIPPKPAHYEKMLELAAVLSRDVPFLRVDFYEVNGRVYFSELTFFNGSGFTKFEPQEWDLKLGQMITLPEKTVNP